MIYMNMQIDEMIEEEVEKWCSPIVWDEKRRWVPEGEFRQALNSLAQELRRRTEVEELFETEIEYQCPKCGRYYEEYEKFCVSDRRKIIKVDRKFPENYDKHEVIEAIADRWDQLGVKKRMVLLNPRHGY